MPKYRKKPVVIEARGPMSDANGPELAAWCGGRYNDFGPWVHIPTPEGEMRADLGDYIIRGVAGEFYPCKRRVFETTYEPVDQEGGE